MLPVKVSFHVIASDVSPDSVLDGFVKFNPEGNNADKIAVDLDWLRLSSKVVVDLPTAHEVVHSIVSEQIMKKGKLIKELALYRVLKDSEDSYQTAYIGLLGSLKEHYETHEHTLLASVMKHQETGIVTFRCPPVVAKIPFLIDKVISYIPRTSRLVVMVDSLSDMPVVETSYPNKNVIYARYNDDRSKYEWSKYIYVYLDVVNNQLIRLDNNILKMEIYRAV